MSYARGMAYGGPVEDFSAKIREFFSRESDYQARVRALPDLRAQASRFRAAWAQSAPGPMRDQALARLDALDESLAVQSRGTSAIAGTIAKARAAIDKAVQLVRKVIPGFGVVDPATITAVLTSAAVIAAAMAIMGVFLSRDLRIREELHLEQNKLEAVRAGLLPADALRPTNKPDTLDKLKGLGGVVLAVAALVVLGPMLTRRAAR